YKQNLTMTGHGSSCGACKFLRRKCTTECAFAPYFSYDQAAGHFAAVHKVFGASNVSKLLLHLPKHNRREAAITISYEALARIGDPIYGCVAHIFALQQQVANLQEEIEILGNQMANLTTDTSSRGSSQGTSDSNFGLRFSSLPSINIQDNLNQQASFLSYTGNAPGMQAFDDPVDIQHPDTDRWEEQILFSDSYPNFSQGTLEEICKGIYTPNQGFNNHGYVQY
ncbi:Lateral organ boundaries, LOB, partial [Dillenia turbinata]